MSETSKGGYREVEIELEVVERVESADGVVTLTLAEPTGADLPEWAPGAHIDLLLEPGLVRQYSLCGDTANSKLWQIGVLRDPDSRGGSQYVHDKLHRGSLVRVRGPRNHFPLVRSPRYVFIAGGIGITPIRTMIDSAVATGADWQLFYGGRSRSTMAYLDALETHGERVSVFSRDTTGRMDLESVLGDPRDDTLVYCCGPSALLSSVEELSRRWPEGALHVERFAAQEGDVDADGDTEFTVECQVTGIDVVVPSDKSIYAALEEAGVDVLGSCLEGICGTCEVDVAGGRPDHRDSVLTDSEKARNTTMMICVSRCRSERLVLDI